MFVLIDSFAQKSAITNLHIIDYSENKQMVYTEYLLLLRLRIKNIFVNRLCTNLRILLF